MSDWRPGPQDLRACVALAVAWVATIALLGVDGEFPVSDDWAYAHTVRVLVEEGRFERLEWTWIPMRTNAAIGWIFAQALGFSFESLRLSSALFGGIGMLGAFALCRQLGATAAWSALAAGLYAWNPVHLPLSLTFMTDVPFGAFVNWSLFSFARGFASSSWKWLLAGAAIAAGAAFSRQPGVGLFACALAAGLAMRPSLLGWLAFAAAALALAAAGLAPERVRGTLELNWYLRSVLGEPELAFMALVRNVPTILFTLGALVFPISLAHALRAPRAAAGPALLGAAIVAALIAKLGLGIPPGIDWWFDFGIGPGSHLEPGAFPTLQRGVAWTLCALAGASGGVAIYAGVLALARSFRAPDRSALWLVSLFPALYFGALAIRLPFFDRYLIAVLAPVLAVMMRGSQGLIPARRTALVVASALPLVLFAVAATHDWREREKARAILLAELLAEGVSAQRIDGGTPFNATHNYGPVRFPNQPGRPFMVDDEIRVGFRREIDGYELFRERAYSSWLPSRGPAAARVHRRIAAQSP